MSILQVLRSSLVVFLCCAVILSGVQLAKGQALPDAISYALLWAAISAAVYLAFAMYRLNRGEAACSRCQGEPEVPEGDSRRAG